MDGPYVWGWVSYSDEAEKKSIFVLKRDLGGVHNQSKTVYMYIYSFYVTFQLQLGIVNLSAPAGSTV